MRRISVAIAAALLVAAITPAVVSAQPPIAFGFTVDCTDGSTFDVNLGPPNNQGTALHIVGSNSILTSNGYMFTFDGVDVVYPPRGLPAVEHRGDGVTCVGGVSFYDQDDVLHTEVWTITGWVTPRG